MAYAAATPRLWSGSGQWEQRLALQVALSEAFESSGLRAAFGAERFIAPVDVKSASREHEVKRAVSTAPAEVELPSSVFPGHIAGDPRFGPRGCILEISGYGRGAEIRRGELREDGMTRRHLERGGAILDWL